MPETDLRKFIRAGQGKEPSDLVLKNVRLLDVISGAVTETDIAIVGDRIVGTHAQYRGHAEIDCAGRFAAPGFIDTHLHIESSLITPFEFERCVLPHGVTTAICDPHEIANVLGLPGVKLMHDEAMGLPINIFVEMPIWRPCGLARTISSMGMTHHDFRATFGTSFDVSRARYLPSS